MIKTYDVFFSNMCYDVLHHLVNFQLKTPPMHSLEGKMNQTIV